MTTRRLLGSRFASYMRVVNLDLILIVVILIPVLLQGVRWKFGTHIGILLVVLVTTASLPPFTFGSFLAVC